MSGSLGDTWHIAAELDRIAEPLLGVEKDGLAGDVISAGPQRLREMPLYCPELRGVPSPFQLLPAPRKVTEQEAADRRVEMAVGEVRLERERAVIAGERFVKPPQQLAAPRRSD